MGRQNNGLNYRWNEGRTEVNLLDQLTKSVGPQRAKMFNEIQKKYFQLRKSAHNIRFSQYAEYRPIRMEHPILVGNIRFVKVRTGTFAGNHCKKDTKS